MRILIVEDDAVLADAMSAVLRQAGYVVDVVNDGRAADNELRVGLFDLVLLDIQLPGIDGFGVLSRLRRRKTQCPVIMVTARDALQDRIGGLDAGADDYLVKPFAMGELQARVRALLRRASGPEGDRIELENLAIDLAGRRVRIDGEPVELTAREIAVLEVLARRLGSVVAKEKLLASAFPGDEPVSMNNVEVQISRLRRKLAPARVEIRPIRGLGYLLEARRPAAS